MANSSMIPQRDMKRAKFQGEAQTHHAHRSASKISTTSKQDFDASDQVDLNSYLHHIGSPDPSTLNTGLTSIAGLTSKLS